MTTFEERKAAALKDFNAWCDADGRHCVYDVDIRLARRADTIRELLQPAPSEQEVERAISSAKWQIKMCEADQGHHKHHTTIIMLETLIRTALQRSAQVDAPISGYTAKYVALCERLRQPVDQGGYDGYAKDPWFCGIADKIEQLEIDLGTQMTMHGAWRKRAEQSEAEFITLKAQVDGLVKLIKNMIDNDPNELISDAGHTVYQLWRDDALKLTQQFNEPKGE